MAISVLLLEDMAVDAELITYLLTNDGLDVEISRVETEDDYTLALESLNPDIILSDYQLPSFDGLSALALRNKLLPMVPFIFVSGALGEERAVAALHEGATDYILKDRMTRLPTAIRRALVERQQKIEREQMAAALAAEQQLLNAVLETAQAMIVILDGQGVVLHANPATTQISGYSAQELSGSLFWESLVSADEMLVNRNQLQLILKGEEALVSPIWRASTASGRFVLWSVGKLPDMRNRQARLVLCGIDITEQQQAEERAYYLDNFDLASGLPNRKLLQQQLRHYCLQAHQERANIVALIMIELPRLQEIRDNYGSDLHDELLADVVQRLRTWQVQRELLARIGEQTFAIAVEAVDETELVDMITCLLQEMREPLIQEDRHWGLSARAGVAVYQPQMSNSLELLQAAEAALHNANAYDDSEKSYAFYSPMMSDEVRARLQLENELRAALKQRHELVLYFQPQIDLKTGCVIGFEALIRWQHPRLGLLLPEEFIPLAESSGLIMLISQWVLRAACQQLWSWQRNGCNPPPVSINLSAQEFASPMLVDHIRAAMNEFDISPYLLEVELTESTSMNDPQATIEIMTRLRKMGLRVSIDDFGTGYSNLSYLKRFPVDRLKLDRAFVRDIMSDADDLAIAHAVIAMAHQLRLEVIAEGVETSGQLKLLHGAGCDMVQGFLFSCAIPADDCRDLMTSMFDIPDMAGLLND